MAKKVVVTIGRQFGSGGHEVGEKLANRLGIEFYDKELIKKIAEESGLGEKVIEEYDEKPTNSLLYSIVMDVYPSMYGQNQSLDQRISQANFDTIKKLGQTSCVIVGRCADYILRDDPGLVSVFVHAKAAVRAERVMKKYNVSEQEARDMMKKTDKKRASYYNFQSEKKWNEIISYNLTIDSGSIGIDATVDMIENYIKARGLR